MTLATLKSLQDGMTEIEIGGYLGVITAVQQHTDGRIRIKLDTMHSWIVLAAPKSAWLDFANLALLAN